MAGKVLIISSGAAFMVTTIEQNLKKAGIEVYRSEPDPDYIDIYITNVDTILLFAGEYVEEAAELLDYIGKVCDEDQIYLCIIGYPGEIKTIEELIPVNLISCEFTRPFEMKNVIKDIVSLSGGIIAVDEQKK